MQGVLSPARVSVMQGVLPISCKGFYVLGRRVLWFYARGSTIRVGEVMQEYLSHARGSVIRVGEVMQEYLSSGARGSMSNLMQEVLSHARGSVIQDKNI